MRIAIVLMSLCAEGTPVLALDIVRLWRRSGVDVRICTLRSRPKDLFSEFETAGVEVDDLGLDFEGYRKFPQLAWRVYGYCRRHEIDAVLCFPFGWHSYVTWGAGLAGVRKVVAHAGNYPDLGSATATRKAKLTMSIGAPWRPTIACCSDYVLQGLVRRLGMPRPLLHTVYNGIDLERFKRGSAERRPCGVLRVGMVARLEDHKDQATLLRATRRLKESGVPIAIELVGDGCRRGALTALADQLGLLHEVSFLGMRRDVAEILRAWDLFVFSVCPSEGLGVALIEALSLGTPVIASDVGACREVLHCPRRGMLGAMFPCGDDAALADAMLAFKANPLPWRERAQLGVDSVRERFSMETMANRYLKLLEEK